MSQYEHSLAGKKKELDAKMKEAVLAMSHAEEARSCSIKQEPHGKYHSQILGVVPFYPGKVGNNTLTGNAHSISTAEIKAFWLKAVTCSLVKYMSHVVIGACNEEHRMLALKHIPSFPHAKVDVINFKCHEAPVHLPYILLRHIQEHLIDKDFQGHSVISTSSAEKQAKFVYFTEMDNALHVQNDQVFDAIVDFVGPVGYVSPNRMGKKMSTNPSDISPLSFKVSGQNICARD